MLAADSTGKWWLVGAGWSGNPLLEREETLAAQPKKKIKTVRGDEEVLFELARKQGMNTDVRRGVFVVLMTSEVTAYNDYR
jgi:nucleolar MIF4G domain-containing protein 1